MLDNFPFYLSLIVAIVLHIMLANKIKWLLKKNKQEQTLDEEIVRKHLRYLDIEEEKLL